MQQDPEILALQRRVEALERILRSGVAINQATTDLNKTTTWTGTTTGLTVGTIVTWTGTAWAAADQDTLNPEDQIGVVISQSTTRITVVLWGNFILDPATVTDQTAYYLDPDTPGAFTATPGDTLVFRCAENGECFIATAGGGGLPDAADGTVFGQIPASGPDHGIPEALSTPELGTQSAGGGSIKIFTDPQSFDVQNGKHIKTIAGANFQANINGTTFDFVQVSTITTSAAIPTSGGIKGQIHCIYTGE